MLFFAVHRLLQLAASHAVSLQLQTVPASEALSAAKALKEQEVPKGRVWLLLAGGSAVLFGATVFLEKSTQLFPAISKANQAMSQSRTAQQVNCHAKLCSVVGHNLDAARCIQCVHPSEVTWMMKTQHGTAKGAANLSIRLGSLLLRVQAEAGQTVDAEQQRQQRQQLADPDDEVDASAVDAVLAGLQSASSRVLSPEAAEAAEVVETPSAGSGAGAAAASTDAAAASPGGEGKSGEAERGVAAFNSGAGVSPAPASSPSAPASSSATADLSQANGAAAPAESDGSGDAHGSAAAAAAADSGTTAEEPAVPQHEPAPAAEASADESGGADDNDQAAAAEPAESSEEAETAQVGPSKTLSRDCVLYRAHHLMRCCGGTFATAAQVLQPAMPVMTSHINARAGGCSGACTKSVRFVGRGAGEGGCQAPEPGDRFVVIVRGGPPAGAQQAAASSRRRGEHCGVIGPPTD